MSDDGAGPKQPGLLGVIVRYSGLGLEMGAAVAIGVFAGWWLDGRFGSSPWGILGGMALGCAAAGRLVWRSLAALNRDADGPGEGE